MIRAPRLWCRSPAALALAVLVLGGWAIGGEGATLAEEHGAAAAPQASVQQRLADFEAELDARLISATDPPGLWLRGMRTRADAEGRARDLAQAHRTAPRDIVYLSALVTGCRTNRVPRPAACAESDWLAKWASVDRDNAAPWVLLAERAARLAHIDEAVADLGQAAGMPRYDEYWAKSAAVLWPLLERTVAPTTADALGPLLLAVWTTEPVAATAAVSELCLGGPVASAAGARDACERLAAGPMSQADTILGRRTAAAMLERFAAAGPAQASARTTLASLTERGTRCEAWLRSSAESQSSGSAEARRDARARLQRWVADLAAAGELSACERGAS